VLRETTFYVGGGAVIALGIVLAIALWLAGLGLVYWSAWLSAGIAVGLGAFFLRVGRDARAFRRTWVREVEAGRPPPPGGPPA
jgi:hypothetical protein